MQLGRGIQAEVLASLAVVMLTATCLLAAVLFATHASQIDRLRGLLGQALSAEARSAAFAVDSSTPGARWWSVGLDGEVRGRRGNHEALDPEGLEWVSEARRRDASVLHSGAPWTPIWFATPSDRAPGDVVIAELAPAVSRLAIVALLLADCAVFAALGAYLLRRRVIVPLRRLAHAAGALAEGEWAARVPVDGVGEAADVALVFNEMSEVLERRTGALEKAVAELRETNGRLRKARVGLDRAERLAAVGRLAAGVAHEVGNPMAAQLAFLELARRDSSLSEDARGFLVRAAEQGERVRVILRQLLDFSRPPRATRGAVDCVAVAEQAAGLVRAQPRYTNISLEVRCEEDVPAALADESIVSQILLNLLLNAADAVSDEDDAQVAIALRGVYEARRENDPPESEFARLYDAVEFEVSDNGPGVSGADRERIFDPFFTTKPPGEGTGLGLANCQKLSQELGGAIEYVDRAECGAAFRLRLPAVIVAPVPSAGEPVRQGRAKV